MSASVAGVMASARVSPVVPATVIVVLASPLRNARQSPEAVPTIRSLSTPSASKSPTASTSAAVVLVPSCVPPSLPTIEGWLPPLW